MSPFGSTNRKTAAEVQPVDFMASNGIRIRVEQDGAGDRYLLGSITLADVVGGPAEVTHATASGQGIDALREYFQHERDEAPWHYAKPGEVWLLRNSEYAELDVAFTDPHEGGWSYLDGSTPHLARVIEGRRIWPVVVS